MSSRGVLLVLWALASLSPGSLLAAPKATQDGAGRLAMPLVAFFDAPACPSQEWVSFGQAAGRLLRSTLNGGQVGKSEGEALRDAEDRTHSHGYALSLSLEGKVLCGANGCCNDQGAKAGAFTVSGHTDEASTGFPFLQTPVCEFGGADSNLPLGSIGFFFSGTCPAGWVPTGQGGQFLVGVPPDFSIGRSVGAIGRDDIPAHGHEIKGSLSLPECRYVLVAGCSNSSVAASGEISFKATSEFRALNLPTFTLLSCERNSPPPTGAEQPPAGILTYFRFSSCPAGWSEATAFERRLLVGLPSGGRPGMTFGGPPLGDLEDREHTHPFAGKYLTCSQSIAGASGCCAKGYGCNGTIEYRGTTDKSSTGLPYVQLLLCRKD